MKKNYWKNIFREVGSTRNRFLAIVVIVALGVCMFTGLVITSPDMLYSGDRYFDQSKLMDLRVISTLGLTENDLQEIEQIDGVSGVMPAKSVDCLFIDPKSDTLVSRIQSIPQDTSPENENYLNQFTLVEGRMPETDKECVIAHTGVGSTVTVGDTLVLSADNQDLSEQLANTEWEIVGVVSVPTNFSIDAETVTVGDGQSDLLVFAPQENFISDIYTTIYLTVEGAEQLHTYSDEYDETVQAVADRLEELGITQSEVRKNEVIEDAQSQLDEAKQEYETQKADAESQLALAEAELAEAEALIEQNEAKLESGEREWQSGTTQLSQKKLEFSKMLTQKQQEITQARKQISQGRQQLELAKQQLESAKSQYQQALDAQAQVESGKQQLESAKQQLALAEQAVQTAENMLPTMQQTAQTAQQAAKTAKAQAQQAETAKQELLARRDIQQRLAYKTELDAVLAAHPEYGSIEELLENPPADMTAEQLADIQTKNQRYQSAKVQVDAAELAVQSATLRAQQLEQAATQAQQLYERTKTSLEEGKASIESSKALIAEKEQQLKQAEEMLAQYEELIQTAPAQIEAGEKQIAENEAKLVEAENQLEEGVLALSLAPAQAQIEFENAQKQLDEAKQQIDEGKVQLEEGKKELEDGKAEFESKKAEAEQKLNDAEDQLIEAQQEIDKIDSCEWYVLDRGTLMSSATFESNADKLASMATVFPVFFFLVAALVALTTMTRMVDENRTQIGVFKALGYSESAITAKYLLYAAIASLAGSAIGLVAGFAAIPMLLWNAYSAMYKLPQFHLQFDWRLALAAIGAATLCTAGATVNACHSTLKERPASLLMPKAPKAGKRILLERIPFIWSRMAFTQKVTARNLFRYKKRFFMTVIGISGCTALLMIGFGIQDSIMDLMDTQYQQLWHYDLAIGMSNSSALEGRRGIEDILEDDTQIESSLVLYQKTADVLAENEESVSVSVTVPQQQTSFADFVTLRTRVGKRPVAFETDSVILTEKAAEILQVSKGDTITVDMDGKRLSFTLTGITENYLGSNLYIAPEVWEQVQGSEPDWNMVYAKTLCEDAEQRSALSQKILERDYIESATFTADSSKVFSDAIKNINSVVIVIILFAAVLAIVVLYNLININVGERKKELATIKVLGFFDKEVSKYIFREIDVLSIIGALCGLALGVPLHQFVIKTVEIDQMMFIRNMDWTSYVYSFILTILFTLLVSLIMKPSLKKIDMVESMKAPE